MQVSDYLQNLIELVYSKHQNDDNDLSIIETKELFNLKQRIFLMATNTQISSFFSQLKQTLDNFNEDLFSL